MNVEQSSQLIMLILNSVLMMFLSAALLGGAWLRQHSLAQQLVQSRAYYQPNPTDGKNSAGSKPLQSDLRRLRRDRLRLTHQHLWSRLATLILNAVLLIFGVSLFALALRSLLTFDSLISLSLILFTLGSAGLLAGTGCLLIDVAQGDSRTDSITQLIGSAIAQISSQQKRLSRPASTAKPAIAKPAIAKPAIAKPAIVSKSQL